MAFGSFDKGADAPVAIASASLIVWGVHALVLRGVREAATLNTIARAARMITPISVKPK